MALGRLPSECQAISKDAPLRLEIHPPQQVVEARATTLFKQLAHSSNLVRPDLRRRHFAIGVEHEVHLLPIPGVNFQHSKGVLPFGRQSHSRLPREAHEFIERRRGSGRVVVTV